ncbi:unnamed protein product [Effrenium voratum]|uniref:EF-hand domain-containing protein n=1 Tax=Effrenium voratum TaxID=2562239 RepID=A0AA36N573_9DINO|nr:unnamed protein product [Effrenium voratum]
MMDENGDGSVSRAEFDKAVKQQTALDLNGDGVVTAQEVQQAKDTFRALDTNGDGVVSRQEVPKVQKQLDMMDENGDGSVSRAEFDKAVKQQTALDRNGDGVVTAQEVQQAKATFRALDTNGDGAVSRQEVQKARLPAGPSEEWQEEFLRRAEARLLAKLGRSEEPTAAAEASRRPKTSRVVLRPSSQRALTGHQGPLHRAAKAGRLEVCLALLEARAFVNAKDMHGCTCLHYAAKEGHSAVCAALLAQADVQVTAADSLGCSALHSAAAAGHGEVCQLLLQHSVEKAPKGAFHALVQQTNIWGQTPFDVSTGSARYALLSKGLGRGLFAAQKVDAGCMIWRP